MTWITPFVAAMSAVTTCAVHEYLAIAHDDVERQAVDAGW